MKSPPRKGFCGFTALLLAANLLTFAARTQTADSLSIQTAGINGSGFSTCFVVPLPDGKILAGGDGIRYVSSGNQSYTNLVRLNSDGSVDEGCRLDSAGWWSYNPGIICVALQTNGQLLIGGSFTAIDGQTRYNVARLSADGTLDPLFDAGYMDGSVNCLVVQPDGQILLCGTFTKVNSQPCAGLCRLNADGHLNPDFNAHASGSVLSIVLQPDGKVLAAGRFTSIGGQWRTNVARLDPSGSLDASFLPVAFRFQNNNGFILPGAALALQPDGKVLVGGGFDTVNGLSHTNIVRLNPDGTLDTDFHCQADLHNCWGVQTFALQTDGKILVGHDSLTINGYPCPYFSRLNPDGSLDPAFSTNVVSAGVMVWSCALQLDGGILSGGLFGTLCGQPRNGIGRLINPEPATQSLNYDGTNILWRRGGASPEVRRASFEACTNGADWTLLGDGLRVNGGWQLAGVSLPTNAMIRARGFLAGGRFCGSCYFVESVCPQTKPAILLNDGKIGFRARQFGFNLSGSAGSTVIIDASSSLSGWTPIATNMLPGGPLYFHDPATTDSACRFYRARLQD